MTGGKVGPELVFLGDSMTAGAGASAAGKRYPQQVAASLAAGDRAFRILAIGGQTSTVLNGLFEQVALPADAVVIIWMGRNNYDKPANVLRDIGDTVAHIGSRKYLILPVLRSTRLNELPDRRNGRAIDDLNGALLAEYPQNFVSLDRHFACSDHADSVHLNDKGYARIAATVAAEILKRGW